MKLAGKVLIVTGGGKGLGKAIAHELGINGATVVIADIDEIALRTTTAEFINQGIEACYYRVNVADEGDVLSLIDFVISRFSKIDILVNNAGIVTVKKLSDLTLNEWNQTIATNLTGTFLCSKYVMEKMKLQKSGKIVNLGSLAGQIGGILVGPDYTASKGGVIALTKALAKEGAPYNININVICPSTVPTPGTGTFTDEGLNSIRQSVPLKRLAEPVDVAKLVLFLVSDDANYITGATLDINGGLFMR